MFACFIRSVLLFHDCRMNYYSHKLLTLSLNHHFSPVLYSQEVLVSRMRFISTQTASPIRFIGLSTALANPRDLADWLGIGDVGVYNFRSSVRPVPLTTHIQVCNVCLCVVCLVCIYALFCSFGLYYFLVCFSSG